MQQHLNDVILAFTPEPIPGIGNRLEQLGGWAMTISYTACAIAFILGGGFLAWDKITDGHHNKGIKIAVGAIIGSMAVASATGLMQAVQA